MPYIIRPRRFPPSALAACAALLVFGAASAQAASLPSTSTCEEPVLSQPFQYANDFNNYVLATGQTGENFGGEGWVLSGGAYIQEATVPGGGTGSVLDLPSGAKAVSPPICVTTEYPTARMMVRTIFGSVGVTFSVSYYGTSTWAAPEGRRSLKGSGSDWTLSDPVKLLPRDVPGWQLVQIALTAKKGGTETQFDDIYLDPYRR